MLIVFAGQQENGAFLLPTPDLIQYVFFFMSFFINFLLGYTHLHQD